MLTGNDFIACTLLTKDLVLKVCKRIPLFSDWWNEEAQMAELRRAEQSWWLWVGDS